MTKLKAKLIGLTQPVIGVAASTPENLISYCARVSNPANQENFDTEKGLFQYCMKNSHWSVFEMVNAVVEVEAPRDISRQLLRHRSFSFQEFSQRYSDRIEFTGREFRKQDYKNRQNSTDDLDPSFVDVCKDFVEQTEVNAFTMYDWMIDKRVAKECARVILPEGLTMSRLYVNGTLRSWMHYLDVRDDPGVTQWEHVLLAREIRKELEPAFPNIMVPKE